LAGRKRTGPPKELRRKFSAQFGQRLEELVNRAGMSAKEFGERIGKSEDTVWSYFRGTRVPRLDGLPKIAKALGIRKVSVLLPDID
jgi:transcriptional regulator with XRE-family HTH domain